MVQKVEDKRVPMTITVKESVQKRLKIYASDNGISMSRVIEDLVDANIPNGFELSFTVPVDKQFMAMLLKNEVSYAVAVGGMMNFDRNLSYYKEVAMVFPFMIRESLNNIAKEIKKNNGELKRTSDEMNNGNYHLLCELEHSDDTGQINIQLSKS